MQKNQKITKTVNGKTYQCIGFPMAYLSISQGCNGGYSHQGVYALDICGKDTGIDETYSPTDMVYKWNDSAANGNAIFFQSTEPVLFADGTINYATYMFIHDNYIGDILAYARQGHVFKQGEPFGDEGTAGMATGNHCHFEVAKGKYTTPYGRNASTGVYCLYNSGSPDKACVVDGTTLINGGQPSASGNRMYWKNSSQIPGAATSTTTTTASSSSVVKFDSMESESWAVRFLNDTPITIHSGASNGGSIGTFVKGETQVYTRKGVGGGHRWIGWEETVNGVKYKCVCAISGSEERGKDMWVELIDPATLKKSTSTTTTTTTPSKTETPKVEQPTATKSYQDSLDDPEQPDLAPELLESQHGLTINVSLVDKKNYRARCPYVMKPEVIVIHNAATPNGTAKALCVGQNKEVLSANDIKSWHFSVDEKEVWQSLPLNRNGFHASDGAEGTGNRKGIAIEIARDLDGEEQYYEAAENNGALLAAILLNKYGWDTSHLKTHHDYARDGKWCPHKILDNGWDKFVAKVQKYLDEIQGKNVANEESKNDITNDEKVEQPTTNKDQSLPDLEETNKLLRTLIDIFEKILSIFVKK